ncbi:rab guanine nucleotide exchange factor S2 [Mitosporidium daphniae]|uniref:GDP/GTP exchange factor Sec2 N-terminal domain-containing protein n=1 Tax=Mitosporidium daphniae TaxID=1485682 RepID=A0A098VV82_9MICR|nr:uncharacterized protein DI09_2p130 [Mitosporidium daphniae]KGG51636.1 hypothetical protein DI09_2p130 [Mitosporidium daphniae]|eukprot:XP_013238063.1 uncharacterized protein DI09_2p130 [Mitosporidium daphniae]
MAIPIYKSCSVPDFRTRRSEPHQKDTQESRLVDIAEYKCFRKEISFLSTLLSKSLTESEGIATTSGIHDEIQALTTSLFEEANNLVAEEVKKTFSLQIRCESLLRQVDEYKHYNELFRSELAFLKDELRIQEGKGSSRLNANSSKGEDIYLPQSQDLLDMATSKSPFPDHQKSPFAADLFSFLGNVKTLNELFNATKPKCNLLLKNSPFNELQQLLTFCNSKLSPKQILLRVLENSISLERQSIPSSEEMLTCGLCLSALDKGAPTYLYSGDHFSLTVCFCCKQHLYLACELVSYLRLVYFKVLRLDVDSDWKTLYYRICHIKRAIFYLLTRSVTFFSIIDF